MVDVDCSIQESGEREVRDNVHDVPGRSILSTKTTTTLILFSHHNHLILKSSVQDRSSGYTHSLNHGRFGDCSITTCIKMEFIPSSARKDGPIPRRLRHQSLQKVLAKISKAR